MELYETTREDVTLCRSATPHIFQQRIWGRLVTANLEQRKLHSSSESGLLWSPRAYRVATLCKDVIFLPREG